MKFPLYCCFSKAELMKVGFFFRTQFSSLGIFIKSKKLRPLIIQLLKLVYKSGLIFFDFQLFYYLTKIPSEGNLAAVIQIYWHNSYRKIWKRTHLTFINFSGRNFVKRNRRQWNSYRITKVGIFQEFVFLEQTVFKPCTFFLDLI